LESGSRDSTVGIATCYRIGGWGAGVRVPTGTRFSPFHVVLTGSGAKPASYPVGPGDSFPRGKLFTHLVPRSRICGSIHPLSHTSL
jgi:hypothetical protein